MPGPISYHAAACPSRGGQWRGLVSHRGAKAEVLLGAAVGRVSQFKLAAELPGWWRKVEAAEDEGI